MSYLENEIEVFSVGAIIYRDDSTGTSIKTTKLVQRSY